MNILGINYAFHDSSACLVQDGQLIAAIEEERLTREKHTHAFPSKAISRCLQIGGLAPNDIDHVAVSIKPNAEWQRKVLYGLRHAMRTGPFNRWRSKNLARWFDPTFAGSQKPQLHYVQHHLAHAVGSFVVSPYDSAALLAVDQLGEWATTFRGVGRGNAYECFGQDYHPRSLGGVYSAATEFCGFLTNYDEGKTMGLAPYGNPSAFGDLVPKLFWVNKDSSLGVDFDYFFKDPQGRRCSDKFHEVFGEPREPRREAAFEQRHLDVAATFQKHLEECLLTIARSLHARTQEDYLVISGGVALNSVANGRLVRESGFKDVYVMPGAGDNGTCIGAAYFVHNQVLGNPRTFVHDDPFVGTSYSDTEIRKILDECKLDYQTLPDEVLETRAAELLHAGAIVGWFQGRMEMGPRALGNRSILADPTLPGMKDKINAEVKHREPFRPFAPSCPLEDTPRFFEQNVADPFMLKVCNVRPEMRAVLPAITHVDGSARLQTVHKETNPRYYRVLKEFEKLSGVPVLLNTSFNVMGEPIVESPIDAIRCFYSTGMDYLILGNNVVAKAKDLTGN